MKPERAFSKLYLPFAGLLLLTNALYMASCSNAPSRPANLSSRSGSGELGKENKDKDNPEDLGGSESQDLSQIKVAAPLRKLTNTEYTNTIKDLFGESASLNHTFIKESSSSIFPFPNRASEQTVPALLANQYLTAAEKIAETVVKTNLTSILSCSPAKGEEECAKTFIKEMGAKAFRRPVSDEQMTLLFSIWSAGRKAADFNKGVEWVLTAMLQMPEFLYHLESGSEPVVAGVTKLDSYDMASRLSYFILGTMPDAALMAAAKEGKLTQASEVEAQAERLLKLPQAKAMVERFHIQWMGMDSIETLDRDATAFPGFSPQVANAMREEVRAFVGDVVFEGDGKIKSLFGSRYTYLNATLGDYYGIKGLTSKFEKVEESRLGGRPAAGLLTMGGVLALRASRFATSPTIRGAFVRSSILCQPLPAPPPDAVFMLPEQKANQTRRQLVEMHASSQACVGCHRLMDPIGLGLEGFDAGGRHRNEESGQKIDVSGELFSTDVDGKFASPSALATKLSTSDEVNNCAATHWFQYAFGRDPDTKDKATVRDIAASLKEAGTLSAIKAVVRSPQFNYRFTAEGVK